MRRLENGELDREAYHAAWLIENYGKLLRQALKLGFSYNDDVVNYLHNERALWWQKIEGDSNFELLVKEWKNGEIHVYDRAEYLAGKKQKHGRWTGVRNKKGE